MNLNMKKKVLPILTMLLLLISMLPISTGTVYAQGEAFVDCDGFKCRIEPTKQTAVICGRADGNTDTELTIPASIKYKNVSYAVTTIDKDAFSGDSRITGVTVKKGITEIGFGAFFSCSNLETINLPDTLNYIDNVAFWNTAYYNKNENWDGEVLYIGKHLIEAEGGVNSEYTVKDGTRVIANGAFHRKNELTKVTVPASVITIGYNAFFECKNLSQVNFMKGSRLKVIGKDAFAGCEKLSSFRIPASVTDIRDSAFSHTALTNIALPEGLRVIDTYLFDECSKLVEVTIPSTVTEIRNEAFLGCDSLSVIHFGGSKSQWSAITGDGKPQIEPADYGEYYVKFVDGWGNILKTEIVKRGKSAAAPTSPKRAGYTFIGWDKGFSKVIGDMTVTAKWKKSAVSTPVISGTLLAKMIAQGKSSLVISWNKVRGVEGYDIFFVKTGKRASKKVKTIKGNKTFKWRKAGLKKKTAYRAVVKAYVTKKGKKTYVRTSPMVCAYTSGGTSRYTNAKRVTVKKARVSFKKGRTYKIKASVTKLQKGKKLMPSVYAVKLRYVSSNRKIVTVDKAGKIIGRSKGSCKVYVIAANGVWKAITVTVK